MTHTIKFSHVYPKLHGQTTAYPASKVAYYQCSVGKVFQIETPEPPDCSRCRHFCGFRQMEIDFDTGDTMETVQCDTQVFATPDMAAHCRYYQRKGGAA